MYTQRCFEKNIILLRSVFFIRKIKNGKNKKEFLNNTLKERPIKPHYYFTSLIIYFRSVANYPTYIDNSTAHYRWNPPHF